jgi:biopolymer transport protein ExbB
MNLDILKGLALTGGDWVIYLLLLCSVAAVAVILERAYVLAAERRGLAELRERFAGKLAAGELGALAKDAAKQPGAAARILAAGLASAFDGAASAEERLAAAALDERRGIESRLLVLGTLGNNAPFIGLFGTVLGVIKAFHDLAQSSGEGPETVMRGLSEALIATAVGLFVAIPCVVAFNYFQKQVKDLFSGSESLNRLLIARLKTR